MSSRTPNRVVRRVRAAVLVGDLRGFTRLSSRLDPEQAVMLLEELFTVMADLAVSHRAEIECVMGDALVLLFRPTGSRRDDTVRAVRTGLALQRGFLALRNRWLREDRVAAGKLGLAIGIAGGEMILADLASAPERRTTAIGEPLNRAARLCASAQSADVLVDEVTFKGAHAALEREVLFATADVAFKNRGVLAAYRAQMRRAGLHVVSRAVVLDPVCGAEIAVCRSSMRRVRHGETYFFCSRACASRFTADPDSWVG